VFGAECQLGVATPSPVGGTRWSEVKATCRATLRRKMLKAFKMFKGQVSRVQVSSVSNASEVSNDREEVQVQVQGGPFEVSASLVGLVGQVECRPCSSPSQVQTKLRSKSGEVRVNGTAFKDSRRWCSAWRRCRSRATCRCCVQVVV
jgi:hypothetical protein